MSRIFNFSAGPAVLPEEVLARAGDEMLDWHGTGMCVMEMSHRGKEFIRIAAEAEADLRELLAVPKIYKVLFLQGGATQQFAQVPMNLLAGASADYLVSGAWSIKAYREAKHMAGVLGGRVRLAGSTEATGFRRWLRADELALAVVEQIDVDQGDGARAPAAGRGAVALLARAPRRPRSRAASRGRPAAQAPPRHRQTARVPAPGRAAW